MQMKARKPALPRAVIWAGIVGWVAVAVVGARGSAGAPAPLMKVLITPSALNKATGEVTVDLTIEVPRMDVPAGAQVGSLDVMVPGQPGPQPVTDVSVTDAQGAVPLMRESRGSERWSADRAVNGDVVIRYRLPIRNVTPIAGGPPTNLRVDGDGFSGVGSGLIMQPRVSGSFRIALDWNLAAMGPGAEGVSSFGDGNVRLEAGSVKRLQDIVLMAGHLQREPSKPVGAFSAVWLGDPGFDAHPIMHWTGELHAWMSRFFRDKTEPPYRVFLRYNPMNAGGGAALYHSFIATYGTGVTGESLKSILGHEMTHTWTSNHLGNWYNEGTAVHYQALFAWRAHLISTADFLTDLNLTASRYYTDALRNTPEDQVQPHFWEDTRIRVLPYDRGAMYFAVLDAQIRKESGGKRSVDDLVREMVDRGRAGEPVTLGVWLDLLRQALGPEGVQIHQTMMAGGLILPASDAFGPCFRRVVRKIRQFDVGFSMRSLVAPKKVIEGLMPGSEAAKAGLRDGDVITYAGSLDQVQADVQRTLTFQVTRDGRTFPIVFLPRGKAVDAYQWERIPGVPDSACVY
jgi:predicted metalloprotease with PDZ domain